MSLFSGALAGIRVIDLSRVLGGPYCTQTLGDHGADVIKIEPPQGDETRSWGPPFKEGLSAYFSGTNRNKRALAIDLSCEDGQEILLRLLEDADVLVHNFKSGTLERWGIGYDDVLKPRFPRLVYCHITGFGETGPLGQLPGYDAVVQAMAGMMSINGTPETAPVRMGTPMVDIGTGLISAFAILAALLERHRSGLGQKIDIALYDCALSMIHPYAANALMSGQVPVSTGNAHPNIAPYDLFPTRTKPLYLTVGNNGQFAKLCAILGLDDMANDARFATNASRVAHRDDLRALLCARLAEIDGEASNRNCWAARRACWHSEDGDRCARTSAHGAPRDGGGGRDGYRGTGIPAKLSRTPSSVRLTPPGFGSATREVLETAGFSEERIEEFLESEVVFDRISS
ncbi:MAG: CoA transferase [Anaerolineae bacterium]|nr:CoA transferase [Anaerolineae bacterium]